MPRIANDGHSTKKPSLCIGKQQTGCPGFCLAALFTPEHGSAEGQAEVPAHPGHTAVYRWV